MGRNNMFLGEFKKGDFVERLSWKDLGDDCPFPIMIPDIHDSENPSAMFFNGGNAKYKLTNEDILANDWVLSDKNGNKSILDFKEGDRIRRKIFEDEAHLFINKKTVALYYGTDKIQDFKYELRFSLYWNKKLIEPDYQLTAEDIFAQDWEYWKG